MGFKSDLLQPIVVRLKNPYLVTFTFSWMVLNWKVLAILFFSKQGVEKKIRLIEGSFWSIENTLYYPLITTAIVLFIVPIVNLYSEWIVSKVRFSSARFIHREREAAIRDDGLLSLEKLKAEQTQNEYRESRQKGDLISRYEETIRELTSEKNDLQTKMLDQMSTFRKEKEELVNKYEKLSITAIDEESKDVRSSKKTILDIINRNDVAVSVIRDFVLDKGYRSGSFMIRLMGSSSGYHLEVSNTELFVKNLTDTVQSTDALKALAILIKISPFEMLELVKADKGNSTASTYS